MSSRLGRIALSLFVVFHLLAIVLIPATENILSQSLSGTLRPYAGLFGLDTGWKFFAPNPVIYRELVVTVENQDGSTTNLQWPPSIKDFTVTELFNRRNYHSLLTTITEDRLESFFVPWLCRSHANAERVVVLPVQRTIPDIYSAGRSRRSLEGLETESQWQAIDRTCPRADGV